MNGLEGCYVSTIEKPHECFDLTGSILQVATTGRTLKTSYMKTTKASGLQAVRQVHVARVYGRDRFRPNG